MEPMETIKVRVLTTGTDGQPHWSRAIEVAKENGWGVNQHGCLFLTTGGEAGVLAVYAPHAWFAIEPIKD